MRFTKIESIRSYKVNYTVFLGKLYCLLSLLPSKVGKIRSYDVECLAEPRDQWHKMCGKLEAPLPHSKWQWHVAAVIYAKCGKLVTVAIPLQTSGKDQFMPRDSDKLARGFTLFEFFIRCKMEDQNWILLVAYWTIETVILTWKHVSYINVHM